MLRVLLRRRDYCRTMSKQFQQHKVGCQLWKWTRDTTRCFASKGGRCKSKECSSTVEENTSERKIALRETLSRISSTFGSETVMWLGRDDNTKEVPVISTGSLSLDAALGVGGLPKGRIVEIYGPEASGKTTLSLHVIAEAQKCGGQCLFIDAEHALDRSFAEALGVVTKDLLIAQPDSGEQALSLVDQFIRSRSVDVVVVDSVAALTPQAELDGEMGDAHMALQARLMSQALRKLTHSISKSDALLIFINQTRAKLNSFGFGGPTEVTSGGNALKFYASVRLNIRKTGQLKRGEEGRIIHEITIREEWESADLSLGSTIVDMYAKCGSLEEAHKMFNKMPNRNVVAWGAIISGYIEQGNNFLALELFDAMKHEGIEPDTMLFTCILKGCSSIGTLVQGHQIHSRLISSGVDLDLELGNTLLDMYAKLETLEEAHKTFNNLPSKDATSWNSMIAGLARHGKYKQAEHYLMVMKCQGLQPTDAVFTSILTACNIAGLPAEAQHIFQMIGSSTLVKVVKNKVAPPFRTAEFEIEYGKGISTEGEILDHSLKYGFVKKSGGWHTYNDQRLGNGRENVKRYLRENTELYESLLSQVKEKLYTDPRQNEVNTEE